MFDVGQNQPLEAFGCHRGDCLQAQVVLATDISLLANGHDGCKFEACRDNSIGHGEVENVVKDLC